MIEHVSIGVRDIARSRQFYDAILGPVGYACLSEDATSFGFGDEVVQLWVGTANSPVEPDFDSGLHFCLRAPTPASVRAFHQGALAAGGRDNGVPGLRADYGPGYYSAFVIDSDGYRLEAYCSVPD